MLKRRSLDYGALFYHHEKGKLESMGSITEVAEDDSSSSKAIDDGDGEFSSAPPAGTWAMAAEAKARESKPARERDLANTLRRAEQDMEHMDENLQKLEEFLNHFDDY